MSFNGLSEYVCILLLAVFVLEIDSRDVGMDNCRCTPIIYCSTLRSRPDWRTAGETCGSGYRQFRGVCCPEVSKRIRTRPLPRTAPVPSTTVAYPRNDIACGESFSGPELEKEVGVKDRSFLANQVFQRMIMGGRTATKGSWPWMVALWERKSFGVYAYSCSGFLIDRRHLLSAAHCFNTGYPDWYRARIGNINQNEADEYRITRVVVHPQYSPGKFYNDIAVLTLDREVDFPNFNPICLPDQEVSNMNLTNRGTTVVGWGLDRPNGKYQIILQELSRMPVVSNEYCEKSVREIDRGMFRRQFPGGLNDGFICAGFKESGKDACKGDSGAPLMLQNKNRWYAIGIVSFGPSCGFGGVPGGYTRVSNYLDWIRINTRN